MMFGTNLYMCCRGTYTRETICDEPGGFKCPECGQNLWELYRPRPKIKTEFVGTCYAMGEDNSPDSDIRNWRLRTG